MNTRALSSLGLTILAVVLLATDMVRAEPVATGHAGRSMRSIEAGSFVPFYGGKADKPVRVRSFYLDSHPVTNQEFLQFVQREPRFQRSQMARLFADPEYLSHWASDTALGTAAGRRQPVVFVSWFAARAYCEARGARLPTEAEWELTAQADAKRKDAHRDPVFVRTILDWYAHPARELGDVMQRAPNAFGLYDMHGLVWEWTEDFNASLVSADDRARDDDQLQRVCGGAATGSKDPADYAAFMRYAFRSSLKASYAIHNLGFRCAKGG